jgi:hypothetical protein
VGHKGVIGPGDLQWMTAGRGIVHCDWDSLKIKEFSILRCHLNRRYDFAAKGWKWPKYENRNCWHKWLWWQFEL